MKIAVFPGSFDPVTSGHVNVIRRAARLVDRLYVCSMVNREKSAGMFPAEERARLLRLALSDIPNVVVESYSGLLADYVQQKQADLIVKGVRNARDLDEEMIMAQINRQLCGVETLFLPAEQQYLLHSATVVRELLRYGRPTTGYVPPEIEDELKQALKKNG